MEYFGYASFGIKNIIDNEYTHEIVLSYSFPIGKNSLMNNESNLVKPLQSVIQDGKPFEKLVYVLYQEMNNQLVYVLGTFILSASKRILFFPGIKLSKIKLADGRILDKISNLNHLTLENNFLDWHFTTDEKKEDPKNKFIKNHTKKIDDSTLLWFVMSISSEKVFEELPKELIINFKCSTSDELKRRLKIINDARVNSIFPITYVNDFPKVPHILNFEFFITNNKNILNEENSLPEGIFSPIKELGTINFNGTIKSHSTPIDLEGLNRLLIVRTTKLNGNLNYPGIFISGDVYDYPV